MSVSGMLFSEGLSTVGTFLSDFVVERVVLRGVFPINKKIT